MKIFILTLLLCFTVGLNAQSKKADSILLTNTEWVNKDLNYLRFFKDSVIYNLNNAKHELLFDFEKKQLSFLVKYWVGGTDLRTEEVKFKINQLQKNKLVITPIAGKEELEKRKFKRLDYNPLLKEKQYIFYNRGQLISRVNFKKITFHASTCFGTCPSVSVEITDDGTVFYQGRIYAKEFTGNFTGKLSPKDFLQLRKIINRSQMHVLDQKWKQLSKHNDTPRYNYIVELADGKLIEINTNDQHPILDKLSQYLLDIHEKTELVKAKKKHKFATSNIESYRVTQN